MAPNVRTRTGTQFAFWKYPGRPRYILEAVFLLIAISLLFIAYRYYFGGVFDEAVCAKPLSEICLMDSKIAEACKVSSSCADVIQANVDENIGKKLSVPLVLVEVFYEVLCPDSKDFIVDQVFPVMTQLGGIVNFSMVPYGKASERLDGDEYIFTCQHGERECKGNMIQTCAVNLLKKDRNLPISFIHCMELSHDPLVAGPACAKDIGIEYKPIESCANGKIGNKLQHIMAQRTESLNPKLYWVPWIVVNGVHTEELQQRALSRLRDVVCDEYKGPKPHACSEPKS